MDDELEKTIRHEQLESLGRILAGFSHDMKNHLGIIRESNGLMEDLIAMGALSDDPQMAERFQKLIATIEKKVVESAEMFKNLSNFAHRSDTPRSTFDLNDLLREALTFLSRFARLKQVKLSFEPQEDIPSLYNDPSLLHHIIYRLFMTCLESLQAGNELSIITARYQATVQVIFRMDCNLETDPESLFPPSLQTAAGKLRTTITVDHSSGNQSDIVLTLPAELK